MLDSRHFVETCEQCKSEFTYKYDNIPPPDVNGDGGIRHINCPICGLVTKVHFKLPIRYRR